MTEHNRLLLHLFKECFPNAKHEEINSIEQALILDTLYTTIEHTLNGFTRLEFNVGGYYIGGLNMSKTIRTSEYNAMLHMFYRF